MQKIVGLSQLDSNNCKYLIESLIQFQLCKLACQ